MACSCNHGDPHLNFPVAGPQPVGLKEFWPAFFVPDPNDPGFGHYHCPYCYAGLDEARAAVGLPPLTVPAPKTWFEKSVQYMGSFIDAMFGIRPLPTVDESR